MITANRTAAPVPLSIHATAVLIGEAAIIIRGRSGAGKTVLALNLIRMSCSDGVFARLIGDDRVQLRKAGERLVVAPHPAIAGAVERRYVGIDPIVHEHAGIARLVVDLIPPDTTPVLARLPPNSGCRTVLGGVRLPVLALPESPHVAGEAVLAALRDIVW